MLRIREHDYADLAVRPNERFVRVFLVLPSPVTAVGGAVAVAAP